MHQKVILFLREATCRYEADYIIKIDDDKYVSLEKLVMALPQWHSVRAGEAVLGSSRYIVAIGSVQTGQEALEGGV